MAAGQECRHARGQSAAREETDVLSPKALLLATAAVAGAVIAVLTVLSASDPTEASGGDTPIRGDPTQQVPELPDLPESAPAGEPLLLAESESQPASEVPSRGIGDPDNGPRSEEPDPIINETRTVRIVDDLGTPVPDATIEVWSAEYLADVPPEATRLSNGEGLAEITLTRASSAVLVSKDGVGTSGIWTAELAPPEIVGETIIELRPTGRLRGQVLWTDGVPEVGAIVTFEKPHGGERGTQPRPPASQTTDAEGRFDVEVDTRLFTWIVMCGRGRQTPPRLAVVEPGQIQDLTLKFPAYAISGSLLGTPGKELIEPEVAAGNVTKPEIDGTVDEDGSFSIEITEPATYSVRARVAGLVQDRQVSVELNDRTPFARVDVHLVPAAVVSGSVRWSNGVPLVSAMVNAWPIEDRRVDGEPEWATFRAHTRTGGDGRFELGGLHPDLTYSLSVSREPTLKLAVVREVSPGARDLVVTVEGPLPESVTLTGQVRDARSGAPVTRFEATALSWRNQGYMSVGGESAWHDDPHGRFEIAELQPNASYVVLINAEGYAPLSYGPLDVGVEPPRLELSLSRWGSLRVRASDADGRAQQGATVALWPAYAREHMESTRPLRTGVSDDSGTVSWFELAPGDYWIEGATSSSRGGPVRASVPNESMGEATLVLSESGEDGGLEVTLLDFDGSPAPEMEVRVTRLAGELDKPAKEQPRWTCRTDSAGKFRQSVPRGAYTVTSKRFGLFAFSRRLFVPDGEWVPVELRLK